MHRSSLGRWTVAVLLLIGSTSAISAAVFPEQTAGAKTEASGADRGPDTLLLQPTNLSSLIYSDASCDNCFGQPAQVTADNFQVATGGAGFDLDQVIVRGGYHPGNIPVASPFTVIVHSDAAGFPGAVVCQETLAATSDVLTGGVISFGMIDEREVTLDLTVPCSLSDGSYWIEVFADSGLGTDDWGWGTGSFDPVAGLLGIATAPEAPGVAWVLTTNFEMAVQLTGILVPVELQSFTVE
jgi:hypothetical protein